MPKSGIMRARKYWRIRKTFARISQTKTAQVSSRGIALSDADLAIVMGGAGISSSRLSQNHPALQRQASYTWESHPFNH
jgi:hypothetical protein